MVYSMSLIQEQNHFTTNTLSILLQEGLYVGIRVSLMRNKSRTTIFRTSFKGSYPPEIHQCNFFLCTRQVSQLYFKNAVHCKAHSIKTFKSEKTAPLRHFQSRQLFNKKKQKLLLIGSHENTITNR